MREFGRSSRLRVWTSCETAEQNDHSSMSRGKSEDHLNQYSRSAALMHQRPPPAGTRDSTLISVSTRPLLQMRPFCDTEKLSDTLGRSSCSGTCFSSDTEGWEALVWKTSIQRRAKVFEHAQMNKAYLQLLS